MSGEILPLLLMGPILAAVIGYELSSHRIPPSAIVVATSVTLAFWLVGFGDVPLLPRLVAALVAFWLAYAVHAMRRAELDEIGLATALVLAVPPDELAGFAAVFVLLQVATFGLARRLARTAGSAAADRAPMLPVLRCPRPFGLGAAISGLVYPWSLLLAGA
ncbi:hypothetical protein [Frigidibacter sp. MR17.24]|uniref:hypothetical protein n=1 Tax=Frigidibacter sp. MR17.24 TaxID=3127345 RepID=UPI003012A28D